MNYIDYLLHHRSFSKSFVALFLTTILYWFLYTNNPGQIVNASIIICGFMVGPCFFFSWLQVFDKIADNPLIKIRKMEHNCIPYTIWYMGSVILYGIIFSFLICIIVLLVSGTLLSFENWQLSINISLFLTGFYAVLSILHAYFQIYYKRDFLGILIPLIISFAFAIWSYLNIFFIKIFINDISQGTPFIPYLIGFVLFVMVWLMEYIPIDKLRYNYKILYPYILFSFVMILKINARQQENMISNITQNLSHLPSLGVTTISSYVLWLLPKLILLVGASKIFHNFYGSNFMYFKIRNKSIQWFTLILKKIVWFVGLCFLLNVLYLKLFQIPFDIEGCKLLCLEYIFLLTLIFGYIFVYLCVTEERLINIYLIIWIVLGFIVLYTQNNNLSDVLLIQKSDGRIFATYIVSTAVLIFTDIMLLKFKRR